jgi:hypothetical protein
VYDNALGAATGLLLPSPQPVKANSGAPLNSSTAKYLDIFTDNLLYISAIAPWSLYESLFLDARSSGRD